jgi:hypothetical protein
MSSYIVTHAERMEVRGSNTNDGYSISICMTSDLASRVSSMRSGQNGMRTHCANMSPVLDPTISENRSRPNAYDVRADPLVQ